MPVLEILKEAALGSASSIKSIMVIVIPFMVFVEIIKDLNLLDRASGAMAPILRVLGISKGGAIPLMAGLVFGLSYGAGLIIQAAREGRMTPRDLTLVNVFLVICHSLFEDTLIFVALGAVGWIIVVVRLVLAIVITYALARYLTIREKQAGPVQTAGSLPSN